MKTYFVIQNTKTGLYSQSGYYGWGLRPHTWGSYKLALNHLTRVINYSMRLNSSYKGKYKYVELSDVAICEININVVSTESAKLAIQADIAKKQEAARKRQERKDKKEAKKLAKEKKEKERLGIVEVTI